jgi:hypothetical protein
VAESVRLSPLVGAGGRQPGLETFGVAVREVLGAHPDLASEQCWQQLGQLIAQHWTGLCKEQAPMQTWSMLAKCSETIVKLRRSQKQGQSDGGEAVLEEFRSMMLGVMGEDEG